MKLTILQRAATVIAAGTIVAGTGALTATTAFAATVVTSPGQVQADTTQLNWSGQGTPVTQVCNPGDPGPGGFQNGATAGNYELWIFSTDGGSVSNPPTLTINGTTYGNAYKPSGSDSNFGFPGAWQIVTPYFDPADITPQSDAFTTFQVNSTGSGKWVLTISHGCNGNTGNEVQ